MRDDQTDVGAELSAIFARMAGLLFSEETLQSALDLMCSLAHETLDGTSGAGVTMIDRETKTTAALSDDVVKEADALQYELDEGPCLSAWRDRRVYRIDSMDRDERWPRWASAAAARGMASSLSVPLLVRDDCLGAVKVYSGVAANYDDRSERLLSMFADQAATVLANVQSYANAQLLSEQLKEALGTRQMIGVATGILMAREGVDEDEAFVMLRTASQNNNLKLREIAREVVESAKRAGAG